MLAALAVQGPGAVRAQPQAADLGAIARQNGVTFGAAVQDSLLQKDPEYARAFATEPGMLVPEWAAKWAALQPREGRFETAALDTILRWGQAHAQPVRGHALVWHNSLPDWVAEALKEGRERALAVLGAHMDFVLAHTRAQIRDWDVVNEMVANPPGSDQPQNTPGELRDTPWLRALGPGYVETALRMARERDPTLRLTINEYGVSEDTPAAAEKRRRLLALVRGLLSRGVPLDAVGIQAHLQLAKPFRPEPFAAFVGALRQMGVAVLITELDIRETWQAPQDMAARDALVAERAYAFLSCALGAGVRTVLTWGLTDKYSWLTTDPGVALPGGRTHRGLPLDAQFRRKPMWDAMARAFQGV
ncbi:endo-1,4-beta-xylanase [Teichococcus coralli]|uniref:endo-1,4-beta-xylanase n=1 Tax=Teichococcus coralli TaxID=2545983 RepID=UPI001F47219C|nr:endo-1,4-beta-xylanase [Pseudoroseomonas coralli]